jgi:hypothetical protein
MKYKLDWEYLSARAACFMAKDHGGNQVEEFDSVVQTNALLTVHAYSTLQSQVCM